MLNYREKRTLLITSIISLSLSFIISVPYTLGKMTQPELIIKYIAAPIVISILGIVNYLIKYRNYRPAYCFPVLASYIPVFSYIVGISINTVLLLARTNQVFSMTTWIAIVACLALYIIASVLLIHVFFKALIVFSKNEIMLIDSLFIVVLVINAIGFGIIANRLIGLPESFPNSSWLFIFIPIIFGALVLAFHIVYLIKMAKTDAEYKLESTEELIAKYKETHKKYYESAREEILESLHYFTGQQLGKADTSSSAVDEYKQKIEVLEHEVSRLNDEIASLQEQASSEDQALLSEAQEQVKALEEKIARLEEEKAEAIRLAEEEKEQIAILEGKKAAKELEEAEAKARQAEKEAEEAKAEAEEKTRQAEKEAEEAKSEAELLKAAEAARMALEAEKAKAAHERALAVAKAKKAIKPSYEKLVKYASTLEKDDSIVVLTNQKQNQHKFYYEKKLFLVLTDSASDYRMSFLMFKQHAIDLIVEYPGVIVKAKSPKGENWYKLVNKGELEEKFLKQTIKESLTVLKKVELEKKAEKERIKAEKAAQRKAEREALKAAKKSA